MSFMDNIGKIASEFAGGQTQDGAAGAGQTGAGTDPSRLADGMTQSLGSMDGGSLSKFGEALLHHFTTSDSYDGDANDATQEAGVAPSQVAGGNPSAIATLLQFAKNHPQVLQQAAGTFEQHAPGLLQGVMGRFGA